MTRQDIIYDLQDQVQHNRIELGELIRECGRNNIDLYEEILSPIGYNTCDRCGDYGDSELDLLWVDSFEWDEDNPEDREILKNIDKEGIDYCALCWNCVNKLKKGEK